MLAQNIIRTDYVNNELGIFVAIISKMLLCEGKLNHY